MHEPFVYINKICSAVPPNECHKTIINYLKSQLPKNVLERLAKIEPNLGIEKRHTILEKPFDLIKKTNAFYRHDHCPGTNERMRVYAEQALPLATLALEPVLVDIDRGAITHLIVTSCTGFYAPGLDIDIINRFGLKTTIARTLIGFMGCYAAIPALRQAHDIVRSQPQAQVLVVNLEICSLHFRENAPLDQMISFLLFADGASASLISSNNTGLRIDSFYNTILPDSLDLMRWTIGDQGFFMHLSEVIPQQIQAILPEHKKHILSDKKNSDMSSWAIHPGGRAILDAVQSSLNLSPSDLYPSREILKNFGNMSSATIMFVLEKILHDKNNTGPGCAMAFGPGITLESFCYQKGPS